MILHLHIILGKLFSFYGATWRSFQREFYEFTFHFFLERDYNNFHLVCPYYTLRYLITISRLRKQRRRINIEDAGRSSGTNYNLQARKSLAGTA